MRFALPFLCLFAGTFVVIACSSDETPKEEKDAGGSIIPVGSSGTSGGTTVTGGGDDDDDAGKCGTAKPYDCAEQVTHAKEANCAKFDEAKYKEDCEAQNCATPEKCEAATKALGDCVLEATLTCDGDNVSSDTPSECKDKESALVACLAGT